ncbi:MAG: hypothetical protein ETSY2_09960, partial [Candidatus Entotheonella gemina]
SGDSGSGQRRSRAAARPLRWHGHAAQRGHGGVREIREYCQLDKAGEQMLEQVMTHFGLSARAHDRIRKVARTIADLDGSEGITAAYLAEAIQYRTLDRKQ